MRLVLASAALLAFAVPASAADYYVVQESTTRECRVVSERPYESTWVQVGDVVFETREEAAERVDVLCHDDDDDDDADVVVEHHHRY